MFFQYPKQNHSQILRLSYFNYTVVAQEPYLKQAIKSR